jgi:SAM-dependent methyltransferase
MPRTSPPDDRAGKVAEETLKTFALTHNYNLWVINLLRPYVGRRMLEIGCGIGNLTYYLQGLAELSCVDVSDLYLSHMRLDYPGVRFFKFDAAGEEIRELASEGFDTVACINVLEHIRDARRALANIHAILSPGGRLLLYVPALQCLYSGLDRQLDHFRRYNRRPLEQLLLETGFEIERLTYSNMMGVLGWFLNGKVQRKRQLSIWQTILFDRFVPVIAALERRFRPPFGMSLLAVARKPPAAP